MSLTNTNREAQRSVRSGGLRDLRFAGTVAAGLVAGVLGVGALSAPLLGWTDWPDQLQPGGTDSPVTMRSPLQRQPIAKPPSSGTHTTPSGPSAVPLVGVGTALVAVPGTGSTTTTIIAPGTTSGGGTGSGPSGTPAGNNPSSSTVGSTEQGNGSGTDFGGSGFVVPVSSTDANGNGTPDAWENAYRENLPANGDADGDGLTNIQELYLRTNPLRG